MNSIREFLCSRQIIPFAPEKWEKRLGQKCDHCHNNLTHEKCISLCKCYYFCHQQCFISKFEPSITDQQADVVCQQCSWNIDMLLEATYIYSPSASTKQCGKFALSIILLILSILAIVFTVNLNIRADVAFMLLYFQGLLLGGDLYFLGITIRSLLYIKQVKVKQLSSTKLQIQTSAFKDLQIQTNQQLTKDYLIFESKKERQ